jgi:hypothetical protein
MVSVGETTERVIARIHQTTYRLTDEEREHLEMRQQVGRTVMLRGGQTIIRLRRFNGDPASIAVLAHEVFHAVTFLFDKIRVQLTDQSDEAWAYAVEFLTRKILTRLTGQRPGTR